MCTARVPCPWPAIQKNTSYKVYIEAFCAYRLDFYHHLHLKWNRISVKKKEVTYFKKGTLPPPILDFTVGAGGPFC